MANILIEFTNFPREREIIGQLLIAYGELEFALMGCLRQALSGDIDTATRVLFRVRGESARIEVADAIIRPAYAKVGLEAKWGNAIGAVRVCKNIRNQYAHCHWQVLKDGVLRFMNLDVDAAVSEGSVQPRLIPLSLDLLERQFLYLEYALDWLYFLDVEYQVLAGRLSSHNLTEPKSWPAPPLFDRPKSADQAPR